jgi:acyl carrier protein
MNTKQTQLQEILTAFWNANVLDVPSAGADPSAAIAIDDPLIQLDSLTAVDVLIDIEKVVAKKLPVEKIVRKGGYSSREQFIDDVTKAVEEFIGASP